MNIGLLGFGVVGGGVLEALLAFTEANFTVKNRDLSVALDYQIERPRLTVEAACSMSRMIWDRVVSAPTRSAVISR